MQKWSQPQLVEGTLDETGGDLDGKVSSCVWHKPNAMTVFGESQCIERLEMEA